MILKGRVLLFGILFVLSTQLGQGLECPNLNAMLSEVVHKTQTHVAKPENWNSIPWNHMRQGEMLKFESLSGNEYVGTYLGHGLDDRGQSVVYLGDAFGENVKTLYVARLKSDNVARFVPPGGGVSPQNLKSMQLPNNDVVSSVGEYRFISFELTGTQKRVPGRIDEMWTDYMGRPHVKVEYYDPVHNSWLSRTLSIGELKGSKLSQSSLQQFKKRTTPIPAVKVPYGEIRAEGDGRFISFAPIESGGRERVAAKIEEMYTDGVGEVYIKITYKSKGDLTTRYLNQKELLTAKVSSKSKSVYGSGRSPAAIAPSLPQHLQSRRRNYREAFGDDPVRSSNVEMTMNHRMPRNGKSREDYMIFFNSMDDARWARNRKPKLVFDDVELEELPKGQAYTYIITDKGEVSFGMVEDSWEFGVKHMHIANGRNVVAAGELHVSKDGKYIFNTESGTFSRQIINSQLAPGLAPKSLEYFEAFRAKELELRAKVKQVFGKELKKGELLEQDLPPPVQAGRWSRPTLFTAENGVKKVPDKARWKELCKSIIFTKFNQNFCK